MTTKGIRIYTNEWTADEYEQAVNNGDTPEDNSGNGEFYAVADWREDFGDWADDRCLDWTPATDTEVAGHLLSSPVTRFWAEECSDTAAEISVSAWYTEQYSDNYTGDVTSKSAHLEGDWTDAAATQIRALVLGR